MAIFNNYLISSIFELKPKFSKNWRKNKFTIDQESLERQNKVSMLMAINDLSLSSNQLNLHNGTPVKNQLYFINYQAATEQRSPYRVCMAKGNSIKRVERVVHYYRLFATHLLVKLDY